MKKYVEKIDRWKTAKVLDFLGNFLKNHQGTVNDNDLFKPITDLTEDCDWEKKIKAIFPAKTVSRMENHHVHRARLDFTDDSPEIFREVWNFSYARKRFCDMLIAEIKVLREKYPLEKYTNEIFPRQLAELQKTFGLSDLEINVMLVLAFVRNDMLTIVDGHSRHSDENDKAVFVAKCLDCDISEVRSTLDCKEKLRRYNCVDEDFDFNAQLFEFLNGVTDQPLSNTYFKHCKDEVLPWDFYGNLAIKHGAMIQNLLKVSGDSANILLYGAPGTGKPVLPVLWRISLAKNVFRSPKIQKSVIGRPVLRNSALQRCKSAMLRLIRRTA